MHRTVATRVGAALAVDAALPRARQEILCATGRASMQPLQGRLILEVDARSVAGLLKSGAANASIMAPC